MFRPWRPLSRCLLPRTCSAPVERQCERNLCVMEQAEKLCHDATDATHDQSRLEAPGFVICDSDGTMRIWQARVEQKPREELEELGVVQV
jgi:hypothetical protein